MIGPCVVRFARVRFLFVPYKGETQAMTDVIGGQVSAMFVYTALAVPQIPAGKVRALAVAGINGMMVKQLGVSLEQ